MNAQQIEAAIRTTKEKCLFVDEFAVGVSVRSEALDKKGTKFRKEGIVKMFFLDAVTQKVISEIALNSITAKALASALMKNVSKLEKDLASQKPNKKSVAAKPHYTG